MKHRHSAIAIGLLSMIAVSVLACDMTVGAIPVAGKEGAPGMPKGAKNYITESMTPTNVAGVSTWENGVWTPDYKRTAMEEIPTISFALDGLTAQDEYVMSFWSRFPAELTDWNGCIGLQYSGSENQHQKINVLPNLVQFFRYFPSDQGGVVGEAERMIGTISGRGAPVGEDFKTDVHVKPNDNGTVDIVLYINNERLKGTWGASDIIMGMDAYTPSFVLSASLADKVWGIRVYKVDPDATAFEPDAPKPTEPTLPPETTATLSSTPPATKAPAAESTAAPNVSNAGVTVGSGETENSGAMRWIILTVVIVVVLAGGGVAAFFVIKKVK